MNSRSLRPLMLAGVAALLAACASLGLGDIIQPPRFEVASGRQAELRLLPPSPEHALGAAAVRLWARVENPNPIGLTLTTVDGTFFLEGARAAEIALPLGLPLRAGETTVIPLEITFGFSDLPELADALQGAFGGSRLGYRLEGTVGIDAGPLRELRIGPRTLLEGAIEVER